MVALWLLGKHPDYKIGHYPIVQTVIDRGDAANWASWILGDRLEIVERLRDLILEEVVELMLGLQRGDLGVGRLVHRLDRAQVQTHTSVTTEGTGPPS